MRLGRRLFLIFLLSGLAVVRAQPPVVNPEQAPLFGLIYHQLEAFKRRDVAEIMATIHPESPLHTATEALLKKTKETYELRYSVFDLVLESVADEEARVSFTQITEKISGPQFRNNRVRGYHIFKRYGGSWRFFDSKLLDTEYLEK